VPSRIRGKSSGAASTPKKVFLRTFVKPALGLRELPAEAEISAKIVICMPNQIEPNGLGTRGEKEADKRKRGLEISGSRGKETRYVPACSPGDPRRRSQISSL